jgi:hypothetical protein
MAQKAVVSLTTGMEDPEKVMIAFLVAVGAAEQVGRRSCFSPRKPYGSRSMASRSASRAAAAPHCQTYSRATGRPGGRYLACPICFDARELDKGQFAVER